MILFKCDESITGGDFNLVLDLDIDKKKAVPLKNMHVDMQNQ